MKKKIFNLIKTFISIIAIITLFKIFEPRIFYENIKSIDNILYFIFIFFPFLFLLQIHLKKIHLIYDLLSLNKYINKNNLSILQSKVNIFAEISSIFMLASRLVYDQENKISYKRSLQIIFIDKFFSILARLFFLIPSILFFISLFDINSINTTFLFVIILFSLTLALIFLKRKFKYFFNHKILYVFFYSLMIQLIIFLTISIIFIQINPDKFFLSFILILPLIITIQEIPISITSFGFRELTFIYFFSFLNIDHNIALLVSIFYGFFRLLSAIIFYFIIKFKFKKF